MQRLRCNAQVAITGTSDYSIGSLKAKEILTPVRGIQRGAAARPPPRRPATGPPRRPTASGRRPDRGRHGPRARARDARAEPAGRQARGAGAGRRSLPCTLVSDSVGCTPSLCVTCGAHESCVWALSGAASRQWEWPATQLAALRARCSPLSADREQWVREGEWQWPVPVRARVGAARASYCIPE